MLFLFCTYCELLYSSCLQYSQCFEDSTLSPSSVVVLCNLLKIPILTFYLNHGDRLFLFRHPYLRIIKPQPFPIMVCIRLSMWMQVYMRVCMCASVCVYLRVYSCVRVRVCVYWPTPTPDVTKRQFVIGV